MMNKMMKKAAAMMMVGMMVMTAGGSTVWASSESSSKEIEGWEVIANATCTPIEEYQGTLDESAPSSGYVMDVQFVNSDVVDYYVSPKFYFDMVRESDNAAIQVVLVYSKYVYTPDYVLFPVNACVQETVKVGAGQVANVQYYISGEGTNGVCAAEYATDEQTAYDNLYGFNYGDGLSLTNPKVECYLETEDQIEARYQKAKAAYEAQQNNTQYDQQQDNTQYGDQQQDNTQYDQQQNNTQYDDQQSTQQNNDFQGNGDVVDKIMGRIAGNAADHLAGKIEEKTEGIIDKETIDMAIGALLGN